MIDKEKSTKNVQNIRIIPDSWIIFWIIINDKNNCFPSNKNIRNINDNNKQNKNTYNKTNNARKSNDQKQILSKTLRDFNKRPAISLIKFFTNIYEIDVMNSFKDSFMINVCLNIIILIRNKKDLY